MAKSTKNLTGKEKTTTAAYSKKDMDQQMPSTENSSKYQPTSDVDMETSLLDPVDGVTKLFTDSVKDIYWAENHLVKTLPKMEKAAGNSELKEAISNHLEQTKTHVQRLESVFDLLNKKPEARKCDAMEGLAKEGEAVIETTDAGSPARDLGIIMASQKVEHYEIAAYSGLIKLADSLQLPDASELLSQTLTEENESDDILSSIANELLSSIDDMEDEEDNNP
jgi:ferritin-like metal-binding protein YciE